MNLPIGSGLKKDPGAAAEWYQKAPDAGYEPVETDRIHLMFPEKRLNKN